jgi:predicted alpha/beta-hydrolase family hydrolase
VPCIEIYALTASATKQVTSMLGLAETDSREDDEAAKIELTYSTTRDINRARPTFEMLVVCIIQVIALLRAHV